jgi:probable rRNA maturation factor
MKKPLPAQLTQKEWTRLAERRLKRILKQAQAVPSLARKAPSPSLWSVSVQLIGSAAMTRLNGKYRGKAYPTDVLSFNAPAVFTKAGELGELVICLPVLKRQARERGHPSEVELEILLVHGVLHLLGFDHELGPKQAAVMAKWEQKLLPAKVRGLIGSAGTNG